MSQETKYTQITGIRKDKHEPENKHKILTSSHENSFYTLTSHITKRTGCFASFVFLECY